MPSTVQPDHHLRRQLGLRDLVLTQILTVVGSSWVGIASGLGEAQALVWIFAMVVFYLPMAVSVYYLNREMPLEGGLYVWARNAFGDTVGFFTAWNVWAYGIVITAALLDQIPSEIAFLLGPSGAWIPESHLTTIAISVFLLGALTLSSVRGLEFGKWLHNFSGIAMLAIFSLLIFLPVWPILHHQPIHWAPLAMHLPPMNLVNLALIGQMVGALGGLEYIAILAGESHAPARNIGRSVIIASPVICAMFIFGTGSVLAFHLIHPGDTINYIAPIPQTMRYALGDSGVASYFAAIAILLLQVRIIGAASFILTGVTRLPMTAGWDHLIPDWFTRLHPRFRTPTNSIIVSSGIIAVLIICGNLGVHAAEAYQVLANASTELYNLAYLAMFAIPIVGSKVLRRKLPRWVKWTSIAGFLATLFAAFVSAYPFVDVVSPAAYAVKILGTTLIANILGYAFYRLRSRGTN
jgi:amino acid transporter